MDLLQKLVNTPGVPGREERIRRTIEEHVRQAGIFDEVTRDALGSLVGFRRARSQNGTERERPRRVLLAAHMDQVGFLVSHVSDRGLLRLHPVGAFDPRTLFARVVVVETTAGECIPGVLTQAGRPIHTATPAELKSVPTLDEFYVDVGLPASEVTRRIAKGNMVVLDAPFRRIGEYVVGGAFDNRVGCWALIRAIQQIDAHDCDIYCAWTAQEEVGSRGAGPVSFAVDPDLAISCDTTVCCDVPGIGPEQHISQAGAGVALLMADSSTLSDMRLVQDIEKIATNAGIPHQRSLMLGGGQDGALMQRARRGVPTLVLSCPVKHMHTSTEMVHVDDLASYRDLITHYLRSL